MGIYKNQNIHPSFFHSLKTDEISSNQKVFKLNYLHEILEEQSNINQNLSKSVDQVSHSIKKTRETQNHQIVQILDKLNHQEAFAQQLQGYLQQQEKMNELVLERLNLLEGQTGAMIDKLETDGLLTQAILDQQSIQDAALNRLTANLEENESLSEQLKKHEELYVDFSEKLEVQEVYHNTVMERIDQQEGLIKKLSGEIDHLRSIIYERATHIVEKFESNMNRITKPIQRFFVHTDEKTKIDKES